MREQREIAEFTERSFVEAARGSEVAYAMMKAAFALGVGEWEAARWWTDRAEGKL